MKNGNKVWYKRQFTGMSDCEGTPICEGDIVRVNNLYLPEEVHYILVTWDKRRVGWNIGYWNELPMRVYNVVGNKYDDSHLIRDLEVERSV